MSYTILSARFADAENKSAILQTTEAGDVVASEQDTPDLWTQVLAGPVAAFVPPSNVPAQVTRRAAKQVLAQAGLLGGVQPAIDAITDPLQRELMQIEWDDSQVFQRNRPSLIGIAAALGLSSAQLDQLFIQAGALS